MKATASYDNYYGESPHRIVTLEFASQEDATAYEEIEDIMALEAELDIQAANWNRIHLSYAQTTSTNNTSWLIFL